jgi:hypothetical protein
LNCQQDAVIEVNGVAPFTGSKLALICEWAKPVVSMAMAMAVILKVRVIFLGV